jgi:hypothetical protein
MVRDYSIGEVLRVQNGTLAGVPSSARRPRLQRYCRDDIVTIRTEPVMQRMSTSDETSLAQPRVV